MDYTGRIVTKNQVVPTASSAPGIWTLDEAMQYTKQGKWPPGYQISRSVRLRSSAGGYFNRTPTTTSNRTTWTWSGWIKRGAFAADVQYVFALLQPAVINEGCRITADNTLDFYLGGVSVAQLITTQVFRDPSAWYHLVVAVDTTQATSSNRIKIYINGSQVTAFTTANYPTQNYATGWNTTYPQYIGYQQSGWYLDCYMTEINFIDGQALTPASFGYTDTATGVWQPAPYNGTYGTNGFYLNFSDNSAATATTIGKDYSGNGNNWTPNNISVTAGTTYDSMVDVPINYGYDTGVGGEVRGSYCTGNPLWAHTSTITLSNGNLTAVWPGYWFGGTIGMSTGKWYWEFQITAGTVGAAIGIATIDRQQDQGLSNSTGGYAYGYINDGTKFVSVSSTPTTTSYGASYTTNDILGVAYDATNATITFYKNGSSQGTAFTGMTVATYLPAFGNTTGSSMTAQLNFGQRAFAYTAPSGYKALCTQNLPTATVSNGANYMAASIWDGNQTARTITNTVNGISFQPDFIWTKSRSNVESHRLSDSVRGGNGTVLYTLLSNVTDAEAADTDSTGFVSTGFTIRTGANTPNITGRTYVGWQWKASGSTVSNTAGSITSTVSASTTAGFSVLKYTGTGSNATVGHGLGVAPNMVITKRRDAADGWVTYHTSLTSGAYILSLQSTGAQASNATVYNSMTTRSSTVYSVGTDTSTNASGGTYVAYCFAAISGYSAFGSYTGNGSGDGPFIYLGFRPRWWMHKNYGAAGDGWWVYDSVRNTYNSLNFLIQANLSNAEVTQTGTGIPMDFVANGVKIRNASGDGSINGSGSTYIYAAFAENPFTLARAR